MSDETAGPEDAIEPSTPPERGRFFFAATFGLGAIAARQDYVGLEEPYDGTGTSSSFNAHGGFHFGGNVSRRVALGVGMHFMPGIAGTYTDEYSSRDVPGETYVDEYGFASTGAYITAFTQYRFSEGSSFFVRPEVGYGVAFNEMDAHPGMVFGLGFGYLFVNSSSWSFGPTASAFGQAISWTDEYETKGVGSFFIVGFTATLN